MRGSTRRRFPPPSRLKSSRDRGPDLWENDFHDRLNDPTPCPTSRRVLHREHRGGTARPHTRPCRVRHCLPLRRDTWILAWLLQALGGCTAPFLEGHRPRSRRDSCGVHVASQAACRHCGTLGPDGGHRPHGDTTAPNQASRWTYRAARLHAVTVVASGGKLWENVSHGQAHQEAEAMHPHRAHGTRLRAHALHVWHARQWKRVSQVPHKWFDARLRAARRARCRMGPVTVAARPPFPSSGTGWREMELLRHHSTCGKILLWATETASTTATFSPSTKAATSLLTLHAGAAAHLFTSSSFPSTTSKVFLGKLMEVWHPRCRCHTSIKLKVCGTVEASHPHREITKHVVGGQGRLFASLGPYFRFSCHLSA